MATALPTTQIVKDEEVVTVNEVDVAAFESDDWVLAVESFTTTAQSPEVTLNWLTLGMLKDIAADSGIVNPTEFATKALLVQEILRVKGLVSYAAPEEEP